MDLSRPLHYVLKTGYRGASINFFMSVLRMHVLRHEEFEDGCKATCNGPYDGKWSKTMIGYGSEDDQFVLELTYNYGIGSYKKGNDMQNMQICSSDVYNSVKSSDYEHTKVDDDLHLKSPDGYTFVIVNKDLLGKSGPLREVVLSCSNLKRSMDFWTTVANGTIEASQTADEAVVSFQPSATAPHCVLRLRQTQGGGFAGARDVERGTAFGRMAFGCSWERQTAVRETIWKALTAARETMWMAETAGGSILTDLVELDTPGKATVRVIIVADPDGHEICFVNDDKFRELAVFDPEGDAKLKKAMKEDESDEWFTKHGGKGNTMCLRASKN